MARKRSVALGVPALVLAASAAPASAEGWRFVVIPDTQFYSNSTIPAQRDTFGQQTQWIVDNRASQNIQFVSHIGDIVNDDTPAQWTVADTAMDKLDAYNAANPSNPLPYSATLGNHDYGGISNKAAGTVNYRQYFGSQRYAGQSWYGGTPTGGVNEVYKDRNHYQIFTAGGRQYLHLNLEWLPGTADNGSATSVIYDWAQSVINAHPGMPTVVSTHEHIFDSNASSAGGRSPAGETTWNSLVKGNDQVFMVVNGHYHRDSNANDSGEWYQVSYNNNGKPVYEMLSDYQSWSNGGNGYMRLIELDESRGRINVSTFSPKPGVDRFQDDHNGQTGQEASEFSFKLNLTQRVGGPAGGSLATVTKSFQDGTNGYTGTQDAQLRGAAANTAHGQAVNTSLLADGEDFSFPTQSVVKFDNIIGNGPEQVSPDKDVVTAKLRFWVNDPGSGMTVHRLLQAWDEATATYNNFGTAGSNNGVSNSGEDALTVGDDGMGANTGAPNVAAAQYVEIDVTRSLRAIMNGSPNHGWALKPIINSFGNGTNGINISSSENANVSQRPQLILTQTAEDVVAQSFKDGVNGYTGTRDTKIQQNTSGISYGNDATFGVDASAVANAPNSSDAVQGLIRFDNLFGNDARQVPTDSVITSAVLKLNITNPGSGFKLHEMKKAWDETSTWASLGNGLSNVQDAPLLPDVSLFPIDVAGIDSTSGHVQTGIFFLDVTESLQAWLDGEPNFGWALLHYTSGTDGIMFTSSEASLLAERPELIVRYALVPEPGALSVLALGALTLLGRRRRI